MIAAIDITPEDVRAVLALGLLICIAIRLLIHLEGRRGGPAEFEPTQERLP